MASRESSATETPCPRLTGLPGAGSGPQRPVDRAHLQAILSLVPALQKVAMPLARVKEVVRRDALAAGCERKCHPRLARSSRRPRMAFLCHVESERARADEQSGSNG